MEEMGEGVVQCCAGAESIYEDCDEVERCWCIGIRDLG